MFRRGSVVVVACLALALTGCASRARVQTGDEAHHHGNTTRRVDSSIPRDSSKVFRNDDALFSYVTKYGLDQTIARLTELARTEGDCHQPAHRAGRLAYEIHGAEAFRLQRLECHAGGLHGAIEAYFRSHGIADLAAESGQICPATLDDFRRSQCVHGIGHGLMAWSSYELPDALKACDLLPRDRESCYTGVFMENIVGSLASHHGTRAVKSAYLSDDPHFPCNSVAEPYVASCYFLQTSRMVQLFGHNFAKVAATCATAPEPHRRVCFQSLGRDIGGIVGANPAAAIKACSPAPAGPLRTDCLLGAVQNTFWDAAGQTSAVQFCATLKDAGEKDACYRSIAARAFDLFGSSDRLKAFCQGIEAGYQGSCLQLVRE